MIGLRNTRRRHLAGGGKTSGAAPVGHTILHIVGDVERPGGEETSDVEKHFLSGRVFQSAFMTEPPVPHSLL